MIAIKLIWYLDLVLKVLKAFLCGNLKHNSMLIKRHCFFYYTNCLNRYRFSTKFKNKKAVCAWCEMFFKKILVSHGRCCWLSLYSICDTSWDLWREILQFSPNSSIFAVNANSVHVYSRNFQCCWFNTPYLICSLITDEGKCDTESEKLIGINQDGFQKKIKKSYYIGKFHYKDCL